MASSKGALARRRGFDWERELVNILQDHGFDAERALIESKFGNIGDVYICEPNILIQCKAGKQSNLARALDEAEDAADRHEHEWTPIGACRKSLGPNKATRRVSMSLEDFIALLERAYL